MVEVGERGVEPADLPAEVAPQLRRSTNGGRERSAVEPGDRPDEMSFPVRLRYRDERRSVDRGHDPRCRRDLWRQVSERALLRVEHRPIFGRVRDLENDSPAVGGDEEILIALAGQLGRATVDAEVLTGDALGVIRRKAWCVGKHA